MKKYLNKSRNSGVARYQTGSTYIDIEFIDGSTYRYSYNKPGKEHVELMKKLAAAGAGLSTYINKHVRDNYDEQI